MKVIVTATALALLLAGCGANRPSPDPVERAIGTYADEHPQTADVLRTLHDQGIVKTVGDVGKLAMIMEMSCPFMNFPGATQGTVESVQRNFTQNWQINVTVEQTQQLQVAQRNFCAARPAA